MSKRLPATVRELIKPIFMDLTNDELSKKCLYRKTQNSNDSINNVIWKSWPKYIYVGRIVLEIGTPSAVINFNEENSGNIKRVFKELGINPGE